MKINLKRVIDNINTLSTFNASPGNGVTRLSFTKEDKLARNYIKKLMNEIGLEIFEDGYGTVFGRKEGINPNAPVVMIGSHYDSVINGGKFDGVAGIVAALEILRIFKTNNIKNYYPIEVVAMNDEEGVRFGNSVSNSRAMSGLIKEKELDDRKDKNGKTLREAMSEFGIIPDLENAKRPKNSIKSFLELHIEQGPILEQKNKQIGIVKTIVGFDMYEVEIKGLAGHAGTTPMDKRKDALIAAAKLILAVKNIIKESEDGTVGTVGTLNISPNASNVIAESAKLSIDVRSASGKDLEEINNKLLKKSKTIEKEENVDIELNKTLRANSSKMSKDIVNIISGAAEKLDVSYIKMNSGAAHDAMIMSKIAPTGMIFVPSRNGISHNPDEWTEYEDLKKGIEVMLHTVIKLSTR